MAATFRKAWPWLFATLACTAAVLATCRPGCSAPAPDPARIALADAVANGTADMRQTPVLLALGDPAAFPYLTGGWYAPREIQRLDGSAAAVLWTRGPAAVVEIQRAVRSDLTITIAGDLVRTSISLPIQSITVLWNDRRLTTLIDDGHLWPLRLAVPAARQQLGLNRLVLLPHYWLDPSPIAQTLQETRRALRIASIELDGDGTAPADRPPAATARGADIVQRRDTAVTHYATMPTAARLVGRFDAGDTDARGRILVSADGHPPALVFDSAAVRPDPASYDIDLAVLGGRAAGLTFVVNGTRGEAATWLAPTLVGKAAGDGTPPAAGASVARDDATPPNILLVLFDTMRADATAPYGAPVGRTPAIARLAHEGTVFRNAFATAASTRVSVASMLTGLYPPQHGAVGLDAHLSDHLAYLPEMLAARGYRTVGVVNNPQLAAHWGFGRGFDAFEELFRRDEQGLRRDYPDPRARARWTWETYVAPALTDRAGRPFFVYLHELDPHFPYEPLPPYDAIEDTGYRGAPLVESRLVRPEHGFFQTLNQHAAVNRHAPWLDAASRDALHRRYTGEVAYMDAYLGWILDFLDDSGLRRDTVVVLASDHGEEFFEHEMWGHGPQLYDPAVRVPLIIAPAGTSPPGTRVEAPVELIDLTPTLLGIAGAEQPEGSHGRDLLAERQPGPGNAARPAFAYGDWVFRFMKDGAEPVSRQESLRIAGTKLIRTRHQVFDGTFLTYELYDLAADPAETINLWFSRPVLGHALRQRFAAQDVTAAAVAEPGEAGAEHEAAPVDPTLRQRLRALGYAQ